MSDLPNIGSGIKTQPSPTPIHPNPDPKDKHSTEALSAQKKIHTQSSAKGQPDTQLKDRLVHSNADSDQEDIFLDATENQEADTIAREGDKITLDNNEEDDDIAFEDAQATQEKHIGFKDDPDTQDPSAHDLSDQLDTLLYMLSNPTKSGGKQETFVDLISNTQQQPILSALYQTNPKLVTQLIESRLQAHINKAKSESRLIIGHLFQSQKLTIPTQLLAELEALKQKDTVQTIKFDEILKKLQRYEENRSILPYETTCQAVLIDSSDTFEAKLIGSLEESPEKVNPHYLISTNLNAARKKINAQIKAINQQSAANILTEKTKEILKNNPTNLVAQPKSEALNILCNQQKEAMQALVVAFYRNQKTATETPLAAESTILTSDALLQIINDDPALLQWLDQGLMTSLYNDTCTHLIQKHQQRTELSDRTELSKLSCFVGRAKKQGISIAKPLMDTVLTEQAGYLKSVLGKADHYATIQSWEVPPMDLSETQIKAHLTCDNATGLSQCIQTLNTAIFGTINPKTFEDMTDNLRINDQCSLAQINYFFECAQEIIKQPEAATPETKVQFEQYLTKISNLHSKRVPADTFQKKTFLASVVSIGYNLLAEGEEAIPARLKTLHLEYQLRKEHQYDFYTEVSTHLSDSDEKLRSTLSNVAQIFTKGGTNFLKNPLSFLSTIKEIFNVQSNLSTELMQLVRDELNDFALLCEVHPALGRQLAGNIGQVIAILKSTALGTSDICNAFQQLEERIGGEAMAIFMTEGFEKKSTDLSDLPPETISKIKRIYAWCEFFQHAPVCLSVANGSLDVMRNLCSGAVIGAGFSFMRALWNTGAAHVIQTSTSKLSDNDIKLANAAILSSRYGVEEAALRIQHMQTAAGVLVDQSKGRGWFHSLTKAFFRPLTTRFVRWHHAYKAFKSGESKWSLFSESLKITALFAPLILGTILLPAAGLIAGEAILGFQLFVVPTWSYIVTMSLYKFDALEDIAELTLNKIKSLLEPNLGTLKTKAIQDSQEAIKRKVYAHTQKRLGYIQFYQDNPDILEENKELINNIKEDSKTSRETDPQYAAHQATLVSYFKELTYLKEITRNAKTIEREEVLKRIPEALKDKLPTEESSLVYWSTARIQQLNELFLHHLCTTDLPDTEAALIKLIEETGDKILISSKLDAITLASEEKHIHRQAQLEKANELAAIKLQAIVTGIYVESYQLSSSKIIERSIKKATGDRDMAQRQFQKILENSTRLNYNAEFNIMKAAYKNFQNSTANLMTDI